MRRPNLATRLRLCGVYDSVAICLEFLKWVEISIQASKSSLVGSIFVPSVIHGDGTKVRLSNLCPVLWFLRMVYWGSIFVPSDRGMGFLS